MNNITLAVISILVVTGGVWLVNRLILKRLFAGRWADICPICAGVSATWLWMVIGQMFGYQADKGVVALLIGGSVVGLAFKIQEHLPTSSHLLWKIAFIPLGFWAAYALVKSYWPAFVVALIALISLAAVFLVSSKQPGVKNKDVKNKAVEEIEKKMKSCC